MLPEFCKTFEISIVGVTIPGEDFNHTEYTFGSTCAPFDDQFSISIASVHESLFGVVTIIFYRRFGERKTAVGFIKLRIKWLQNKILDRNITVQVLPIDILKKADSFEEEINAVGESLLSISAKPLPTTLVAIKPAPISQNILGFFILENKMRIYRIVYDLFSETQRGTMLCRIHWLFGLISAEHYFSTIYNSCIEKECQPNECNEPFCRSSYKEIPLNLAEEAMVLLQYAASSFANSIMVWRLKKLRNMPEIRDSRRRAILERIDAKPEDLYRDQHGTDEGLGFVVFFINNQMVVSFKGTSSTSEAIHDLDCEYVEFLHGYAHSGILRLADHFIRNSWIDLRTEMARRGVNRLLLTGYSLGAAASTLVYLRFCETGIDQAIDINVVGFCSPPVVSASIAAQDYPKIRIFNYGADLITRLNFGSVLDLKYICISISSLYDYFTNKARILEKVKKIKEYLSNKEIYTKLYHVGTLFHIKNFDYEDGVEYLIKNVSYGFFEDLMCVKRAPFDHVIHNIYNAFSYAIANSKKS